MPTSRFEPSSIKNKIKREEIARKQKKAKRQDKLQRRLAQAKAEASDPLAKKVRTTVAYYRHSTLIRRCRRNDSHKMYLAPWTTCASLTRPS